MRRNLEHRKQRVGTVSQRTAGVAGASSATQTASIDGVHHGNLQSERDCAVWSARELGVTTAVIIALLVAVAAHGAFWGYKPIWRGVSNDTDDWHGIAVSSPVLTICDIPTVGAPSASPTDSPLPISEQPFRVTLDPSDDAWYSKGKWHRRKVRERFGNLTVAARTVASAVRAQFGHATLPLPPALQKQAGSLVGGDPLLTSLQNFTDMLRGPHNKRVVFDVVGGTEAATRMRNVWPTWPSMFPRPSQHQLENARPALSIGGNGTGLAFHAHGAAWLATLKGKKLWFIIDPTHWPVAQHNGETPLGLQSMTPRLAEQLLSRRVEGLYVCVVGPSEAVYIPQGWHHATLNLGETLSVGTQLPVSFEQKTTPHNPADVTTALEAAWYGERLHASGATDGGGASAIAYLQRAVDVEPLNFKFAANLISALLSQRRFEAAVSITSKTASTALNVADPQDAVYVVSFFALRFLEAAALEDDASSVIAANLVDMAKRLIDAAATVATLDEGVRRLRNMLP